jgi:hypothetical protein
MAWALTYSVLYSNRTQDATDANPRSVRLYCKTPISLSIDQSYNGDAYAICGPVCRLSLTILYATARFFMMIVALA